MCVDWVPSAVCLPALYTTSNALPDPPSADWWRPVNVYGRGLDMKRMQRGLSSGTYSSVLRSRSAMNWTAPWATAIMVCTTVVGCTTQPTGVVRAADAVDQKSSSATGDVRADNPNKEIRRRHGDLSAYEVIINPSVSLLTKDDDTLSVEPLSEYDLPFMREVLQSSLAAYPENLVRESLTLVVCVSSAKLHGAHIGGTWAPAPDRIIIARNGNARGARTKKQLEASIHHEFATLLLYRNQSSFSAERWIEFLPLGYRYPEFSVALLADPEYEARSSQEWAKRGFVTGYAQSSIGNDIAETITYMMMGVPWLWDAYDKHPRIAGKVNLLVDWLHGVDSTLTLEYIRGLASR